MKKIFSIEWPDGDGPDWMSLGNLKSCLFSKNHIARTSSIVVEDITEKAEKALSIGKPPYDVEEYYKEGDTTGGFVIEWTHGKPEHITEDLLRSCLFGESHLDAKPLNIKEIVDKGEPSEFNKMASTKYIHRDDVATLVKEGVAALIKEYLHRDEVVTLVKELADKFIARPNATKGTVVGTVNALLKRKGIVHRKIALNWDLVVVEAYEAFDRGKL